MEEAVGPEKSAHHLTLRILTVSFAAIHTSSMVRCNCSFVRVPFLTADVPSQSFAYALYRLATFPEYIQPLREEVETVVAQEGWTKQAMQRMRKVDSFLKECQRMDGLGSRACLRVASAPVFALLT